MSRIHRQHHQRIGDPAAPPLAGLARELRVLHNGGPTGTTFAVDNADATRAEEFMAQYTRRSWPVGERDALFSLVLASMNAAMSPLAPERSRRFGEFLLRH